jgi:hypothetical protein
MGTPGMMGFEWEFQRNVRGTKAEELIHWRKSQEFSMKLRRNAREKKGQNRQQVLIRPRNPRDTGRPPGSFLPPSHASNDKQQKRPQQLVSFLTSFWRDLREKAVMRWNKEEVGSVKETQRRKRKDPTKAGSEGSNTQTTETAASNAGRR